MFGLDTVFSHWLAVLDIKSWPRKGPAADRLCALRKQPQAAPTPLSLYLLVCAVQGLEEVTCEPPGLGPAMLPLLAASVLSVFLLSFSGLSYSLRFCEGVYHKSS